MESTVRGEKELEEKNDKGMILGKKKEQGKKEADSNIKKYG